MKKMSSCRVLRSRSDVQRDGAYLSQAVPLLPWYGNNYYSALQDRVFSLLHERRTTGHASLNDSQPLARLIIPPVYTPPPHDCRQLGDGGLSLVEHAGGALGGSVAVRFFFFWLYVLTMTLLAAFLTSYFCPAVEGSGIPVSLANRSPLFPVEACVRSKWSDGWLLGAILLSTIMTSVE